MELRATIVLSCWFTVALISSIYMLVFGREVDIMFGVFMPIGFLILVAIIVSFIALSGSKSEKNHNKKQT